MKPIPTDLSLNRNAGAGLRLRSGDSVLVQVIKRLGGNKWAVGIRGRVVPALSEVQLLPGQRLRALVRVRDGRITLKISDQPADAIRELIAGQGLQPDEGLERIVAAFLRSGLGIAPEGLQQARRLLERLKLDPRKFARLLAILLEKGIDPRSRGLEQLLALLGYGERESGEGRGRRRKPSPDPEGLMGRLRRDIEDPENPDQGSGVQLFNHLRGSQDSWVIIPFDYSQETSGRIYGSLRLRYDPWRRRTDRLIVVARTQSGGKWSFVLDCGGRDGCGAPERGEPAGAGPSARAPVLRVFGGPGEEGSRRSRRELDVLRLKLQNIGVETDDTIREDQDFDGFDLPWEEVSYHNVDTVH